MSLPLTPAEIAQALPVPPGMVPAQYVANIAANWPAVVRALETCGVTSDAALIAALATIRVECPPFKPVKEYGGAEYLNRMYDTRTDLGNTPELDGDGARYCGRGFAQVTGRANYEQIGRRLGLALVDYPDTVLTPAVNAAVFADFFAHHRVAEAAEAGDWVRVRKIWNGGHNGLADFLRYVETLKRVCHDKGVPSLA